MGSYQPVAVAGSALACVREAEGTRFLMALNLGHAPALLELETEQDGQVEIGTDRNREGEHVENRIELRGDEGVVVRMDP